MLLQRLKSILNIYKINVKFATTKQLLLAAAASFIISQAHGTRQVSRQSARHANFVIPGKRRKANRCQVLITHVMPD